MKFIVDIELETKQASTKRISEYIKEAIESWGGQFDPEHTFYSGNVKVLLIKEHETQK